MASSHRRLYIPAILTSIAILLCIQPRHATAAASTQPSLTAAPATAPSPDAPAPDNQNTTRVRRGTLALSLDFDGVFIPLDPMQVRLNTLRYHDDFIIKNAIAPGTKVSKGDVLLELETPKIDQQIAAAQNDLDLARANLAKAQSDVSLGAQSDALATSSAKDSLTNAQTALKRWDGPDGANFLLASQMGVKTSDFDVQNATDELRELRKMYKSEDLTNETTDIVMKRAIGTLELQKMNSRIVHTTAEKAEQIDAAVRRQQLVADAAQQALAMDQLQAAQAQGQVVRQTALVSAQAAAQEASDKLNDLKKDRQNFSITSAIDGIVVYGSFDNGAWQPIDASHLAPGEKVQADQVLMTVFTPENLQLQIQCPESQIAFFSPGAKITVIPTALPGTKFQGVCQRIPIVSQAKGSQQIFNVLADLPPVDAQLAPGFSADVNLDAGTLQNVLLVPNSALSHGKVWVTVSRAPDEKTQPQPQSRIVVPGRSNGQQTEIKSGLAEDELVLTQAKDSASPQN